MIKGKPAQEKITSKRPFDLVQETEISEKENSASDSSSETLNSKRTKTDQKIVTKRNIRPTQLIETDNDKEENKLGGIYTKKIQSGKRSLLNESPPKNVNSSNKTKVDSPVDDCIILD